MKPFNNQALIVILLMPFFYSCSTYQMRMSEYSYELHSHQYDKAIKSIEKNKILKHKRNLLLYNMELGRLYMLNNNPQKSNEYFNAADALLESNYKNLKDVAVSNLTNPMLETYRGEEYEKLLVNYFKAINYANLDKTEDAVVEARRITLATNRLNEKFDSKTSRYSKDPFLLNLQGLIYEMNGDWNNAFIAYRNAADVYLNANTSYYGVEIPAQLKQDLLYAANMIGFSDEQSRYESLFGQKLNLQKSDSSSELILFIEEGAAPVKEDNSIVITNTNGIGSYQYMDRNGTYVSVPFNHRSYGIKDEKISNIRTLKVSMPAYRVVSNKSNGVKINLNDSVYNAELVEDFNTLAMKTLDERYLSEIAKAMARFLVKKAMEAGSSKIAESLAKKNDDKMSEKEKKENRENAENIGKVVGFLVNMTNTFTEKADTRTWLSLPAFISYVRIPLNEGENKIVLNSSGKTININVTAKKGLQLKSVMLN